MLLHSWESIQPVSQKRASGQLGKVVFCGSTKVTTFQLDIIWNKSNYPLTAQGVIISSSRVVAAQHPSQLGTTDPHLITERDRVRESRSQIG